MMEMATTWVDIINMMTALTRTPRLGNQRHSRSRFGHSVRRPTQFVCPNSDNVCPNSDKKN